MPSAEDIIEAYDRIIDARKHGAISVSIHDAMIFVNAYREECFNSLGLEDYDGE